MKIKKLSDRLATLNAGIDYQHKVIDQLHTIISLKMKSDIDYRTSLQNVNKYLQMYIESENGFLIQIVRSYQSYLAVTCQNQTNLIEGYQNEILVFLEQAKQNKVEEDLIKKAQLYDFNSNECKEQIKHYKRLIRQNEQSFQLILTEASLSAQINNLDQQSKSKLNERCFNIQQLRNYNQSKLQEQIDKLMKLAIQYQSLTGQIDLYEAYYMEEKANEVYDNFMRAFVLQVSFNKSMEHDVLKILERINENSTQYRKISFQNLRKRIQQHKRAKDSIWNVYKKWAVPEPQLDINQSYIEIKIRQKWKKVCKQFNQIDTQK